ncbi:MAG TPA: alpha/beta fold hydrolase [Dongiaceae bacterium]
MHKLRLPLVALLALPVLLGSAAPEANKLKAIIDKMGGQPCASGSLTCVKLAVPMDHRANAGPTIDIEHAISFASVASKGILIYVVGGPGGSGLSVADDYLSAFDAKLTENMDIVFFDQRGIGPDHGLKCPKAQALFDLAETSADKPDEAIAIAKAYATDCPAELGSPDLLNHLDTDQAIRDLELFRQAIGSPQVWVYGESYGTQFAQQYATAFPTSVKGVIVDGVVDLALDFDGYYTSYVLGSERILARMLAACAETPACREDMQGDATQVYDVLAAKAAAGPIEVDFPLADGTLAKRKLTSGMLEADGFYALYGPDDRATFLRALAAASRNNLVPLLRLSYSNLEIDPQTLVGSPDPTWYGAAYYAITCSDYGEGTADSDETAREVMEKAKAFAPRAPRLLNSYYVERLACAYWPKRGPNERPKPFAGGEFPTLVLNADTDPITPITMARAVFDNAANAYLVTMKGGDHVIWGRGFTCPDEIVFSLLFDGTEPEAREQICEENFIGEYTPLTLTEPDAAAEPFAVSRAVQAEIEQSPEIYGWDGSEPLAVGCDFGGTITVSAGEAGTEYAFSNCAWWPNIVLDGTGTQIEQGEPNNGLTLHLSVGGAHQGEFTFHHNNSTDAMMVSGNYDGKDVSTPRPLP